MKLSIKDFSGRKPTKEVLIYLCDTTIEAEYDHFKGEITYFVYKDHCGKNKERMIYTTNSFEEAVDIFNELTEE